MDELKTKLIEKVKLHVENYTSGYLEGALNYKFRTRDFLNVVFLYTNSVDVNNPDILGADNRNTFIFEPRAAIEKIKEQVRLDIKDLNFTIDGASSLASFIPRAANRKVLEESNFDEVMDEIPDNAVDYGSGFLKAWTVDKKLKLKSVDPYAIYFNQYDFKNGIKVEILRRKVWQVLEDPKYDVKTLAILKAKKSEDEMGEDIVLHQAVEDLKDGKQRISISDFDNDLVYYDFTTEKNKKVVHYFKFDYQKRKGFPDALGIGCVEKVFNEIVQSKVNRERIDEVMEIASKLPFQKQIDNEKENQVGKKVVDLDTGVILGHKGNPITPLDTGGVKQVQLIREEIAAIMNTIGNKLNVGEALQGNTMPSGTSGILGNLLTENASSVLKEIKKNLAKFYGNIYSEVITPYILDAFNSSEDLRKYLEPNDIRLIEQNVVDYLVALKQVDAAIAQEEFDQAQAQGEVKAEIKGKPLIPGELLKKLKVEVKGIKTFISGEDISKLQTVAFLRDMRMTYATNPQLFASPFYIQLLKKEAEMDSGVSGIEIDNLLKELQDNKPAPVAQPAPAQAG